MIFHYLGTFRPLYYVLHPWELARHLWIDIKAFCQRGWRGYADQDVASLDDYLATWMPGALAKLKNKAVPFEYISTYGDRLCQELWNDAIDKMIGGFEAHLRYGDMLETGGEEHAALSAVRRQGLNKFALEFEHLWY